MCQEEEAQGDDEMHDSEQDGDADGTTDSGAGGDTTASGTGDDTTNGSERTDGSQPKRQKKDRHPNTLGTVRQEFTEVSPSGAPVAPEDLVKGYGLQLTCIIRDTVSINTGNLRKLERAHLVKLLL